MCVSTHASACTLFLCAHANVSVRGHACEPSCAVDVSATLTYRDSSRLSTNRVVLSSHTGLRFLWMILLRNTSLPHNLNLTYGSLVPGRNKSEQIMSFLNVVILSQVELIYPVCCRRGEGQRWTERHRERVGARDRQGKRKTNRQTETKRQRWRHRQTENERQS